MLRSINLAYGLILLAAAILLSIAVHNAWGATGVVNIFEMRFGAPGTPHVVPECGCTFRYVGTRVEGADYFVHFKKLD